jgi:HAD superfamily hydrolase (TIGR01459 family)
MQRITLLDGLRQIAGDYDAFILDLWGVLHDGQKPYPGVVDCLMEMKKAGKKRVILSNAPRSIEPVIARITEIGIPPEAYDGVMTSGQDAWEHLLHRGRDSGIPFYAQLGKRCYFIGPDRDLGLLEKVVHQRVDDPRTADFCLCTGIVEREDMLDVYEPTLKALAKRGVPMICANPDLVVRNGARLELCAGTLAAYYEEMRGTVLYHGKPFPEIYDHVFALLGHPDPQRTLAIGDSLRTDMGGAQTIGIDALLITDGIHAEEFGVGDTGEIDVEKLREACNEEGLSPRAFMRRLVW